MRAFIIALLLVWGGEALAAADVDSANYQLPGCQGIIEKTSVNPVGQGVCMGRVKGVWSMQLAFGEVCSPIEVTAGQAVRVAIQYITARPARLHEDFNSLVREALYVAWPCKK